MWALFLKQAQIASNRDNHVGRDTIRVDGSRQWRSLHSVSCTATSAQPPIRDVGVLHRYEHPGHAAAYLRHAVADLLVLILIILLKYVAVVLNADNKGEGGVLALTALVVNTERESPRKRMYGMLGILGAALFFSDGAITPAISVLSAVEGLHVAAPDAQIPILPITVVVLVGLFLIQRHGTGSVGKVFGPVMLGWFAILAVMGVSWIVREPRVLVALSPVFALQLIAQHQISALAVLAGVFLTVTGGEALYADMGHFGKTPIRLSWVTIVMPALVLNYFGQGAMLIENPAAISNPFYLMPAVVASAARGHRDRGDRHCLASGDLRSVLRHHAGREPGTLPARARRALLRRIRGRSTCRP